MKPSPKITLGILAALCLISTQSQTLPLNDSNHVTYMKEITLVGINTDKAVINLPEIVGTQIYAGKKNAMVLLQNTNAIVSNNNMRQILSKVPGIQIWESDGSGIQIGIGSRGLSPNRSWEFNIRQNGCDIAADPFGYPEAYYNPQMQAVQRIQIVRGAGSLQYGPQFGGMVNYIMKDGSDINKPLKIELNQTFGSFGLLNSFAAIGGQYKRFNYYAFVDHRSADGWRDNSKYSTKTFFGKIGYRINNKFKIAAEVSYFDMLSQQPGGLTDAQFKVNSQQSFRSRNWFNTPWLIGNFQADYEINTLSRIKLKVFAVHADRNSVGYLGNISVKDSIVKSTLQYNFRDVAIDKYRNKGAELTWLTDYFLFNKKQTISLGSRLYSGQTDRYQRGFGTTGSNADFSISQSAFPGALLYSTQNVAFYAENVFRIGKKLLIIPGIRQEILMNAASGRINFDANSNPILLTKQNMKRNIFLGGIGAEFHVNKTVEMYGNYTQAYRPVLFSDLTLPSSNDVVDPNISDAKGWNSDLGIRGTIRKFIYFDMSIYYLQYNNKVGNIVKLNSSNQAYNYRTNIGDAVSKGVELLADVDILSALKNRKTLLGIPVFISAAYNNSTYQNYKIISGTNSSNLKETDYTGKKVENAPQNIYRGGVGISYKTLSLNYQISYVSKTYSDAANTETPSSNGVTGAIPSYTLHDLFVNYSLNKTYKFKMSINNLTNLNYFTRRGGSYPGPGLLPGEGRNILFSVSVSL